METIFQPTFSNTHSLVTDQPSAFQKFINWCTAQDRNRYGWLGGMLGMHGCLITPATVFAIVFSGNSLVFLVLAIIAMMMTLVSNLAALPTKYTIPIFLLSVVIDALLVMACVVNGFSAAVVL